MSWHGLSENTFTALRHHDEYYLTGGDLFFLIEQYHFRVHRYFFERESNYFKARLATPASPGAPRQGTSESSAIVLDDIKADDFAKFLWVFYNPKYSLYKAKVADWVAILELAHRWGFLEVKNLVVREIEKLEMPALDRVVVYHRYELDRHLLLSRYAALVVREAPLTLEEANALGMETTLRIFKAREVARAPAAPNGTRTPPLIDLPTSDMVNIVKNFFELQAVGDLSHTLSGLEEEIKGGGVKPNGYASIPRPLTPLSAQQPVSPAGAAKGTANTTSTGSSTSESTPAAVDINKSDSKPTDAKSDPKPTSQPDAKKSELAKGDATKPDANKSEVAKGDAAKDANKGDATKDANKGDGSKPVNPTASEDANPKSPNAAVRPRYGVEQEELRTPTKSETDQLQEVKEMPINLLTPLDPPPPQEIIEEVKGLESGEEDINVGFDTVDISRLDNSGIYDSDTDNDTRVDVEDHEHDSLYEKPIEDSLKDVSDSQDDDHNRAGPTVDAETAPEAAHGNPTDTEHVAEDPTNTTNHDLRVRTTNLTPIEQVVPTPIEQIVAAIVMDPTIAPFETKEAASVDVPSTITGGNPSATVIPEELPSKPASKVEPTASEGVDASAEPSHGLRIDTDVVGELPQATGDPGVDPRSPEKQPEMVAATVIDSTEPTRVESMQTAEPSISSIGENVTETANEPKLDAVPTATESSSGTTEASSEAPPAALVVTEPDDDATTTQSADSAKEASVPDLLSNPSEQSGDPGPTIGAESTESSIQDVQKTSTESVEPQQGDIERSEASPFQDESLSHDNQLPSGTVNQIETSPSARTDLTMVESQPIKGGKDSQAPDTDEVNTDPFTNPFDDASSHIFDEPSSFTNEENAADRWPTVEIKRSDSRRRQRRDTGVSEAASSFVSALDFFIPPDDFDVDSEIEEPSGDADAFAMDTEVHAEPPAAEQGEGPEEIVIAPPADKPVGLPVAEKMPSVVEITASGEQHEAGSWFSYSFQSAWNPPVSEPNEDSTLQTSKPAVVDEGTELVAESVKEPQVADSSASWFSFSFQSAWDRLNVSSSDDTPNDPANSQLPQDTPLGVAETDGAGNAPVTQTDMSAVVQESASASVPDDADMASGDGQSAVVTSTSDAGQDAERTDTSEVMDGVSESEGDVVSTHKDLSSSDALPAKSEPAAESALNTSEAMLNGTSDLGVEHAKGDVGDEKDPISSTVVTNIPGSSPQQDTAAPKPDEAEKLSVSSDPLQGGSGDGADGIPTPPTSAQQQPDALGEGASSGTKPNLSSDRPAGPDNKVNENDTDVPSSNTQQLLDALDMNVFDDDGTPQFFDVDEDNKDETTVFIAQ
ncbi:hypothetical protein VNI00_011674 [Paramarasmius palmivorus]|uniref:BTB domain-containing protein n=1 Tax=Paramarasmius palmivorus TaxID=297713 RepID=A0AAW0CA35_9AGAR